MRTIRVRHGPGPWLVEDGATVRAFVSGSEAERWARGLAQALAGQGEPTQLDVFDLSHQPVGSIVFHPRLAMA